jgi:catechol 2,3-dioxygenase-like lactoylglutathione lyase family enzyme
MNAPMARPSKFAHLVLNARDFDGVLAFYKRLLGAWVVHEGPGLVFLTYDEEHHRLAITKRPGVLPKLRNMAGVDHYAFTYDSLADLLETWERMKAAGDEAAWCTHHGPTISIYYRDPDGNIVETQVDVFATNEEVDAFIKGEDFQQNPIGVDFDPQALRDRLRAGEPWEQLRLRVPMGPRNPATIPRAYLGWASWLMLQVGSRLGLAPR